MSPRFRHMAVQRLTKLFDLATVSFTSLAALAVSSESFTWHSFAEILAMRVKLVNVFFVALCTAICTVTFAGCGFYVSHRLSHGTRQLREIFIAVTFLTGVLLLLRWPFEFQFATNKFLVLFWLLTFVLLAFARLVSQKLLHFARLHGRNLRNIVIVGDGPDAKVLATRIENESSLGYRVIRIIDARED